MGFGPKRWPNARRNQRDPRLSYLAVTTCNAAQWRQHGLQMAETFRRHWPVEVPLRLYAEGIQDAWPVDHWVDLYQSAPWLAMFKQLYAQPQHRGMVNGKYNYRQDAVKFAHKVAAIGAACRGRATATS